MIAVDTPQTPVTEAVEGHPTMTDTYQYDPSLARDLSLDELFDLSLYQALHDISRDDKSRTTLRELIRVETQHLAFWNTFFAQKLDRLDWARRIKLHGMLLACRLFRTTGIHLVLKPLRCTASANIWRSGKSISTNRSAQRCAAF